MNQHYRIIIASVLLFCICSWSFCQAQGSRAPEPAKERKFDFSPGEASEGYIKISPETRYSEQSGYGFDHVSVTVGKEGAAPFYFSVKVPEGNYRVKVTLGAQDKATDAAIRAECRRMMVNRMLIQPGEFKTVDFTVHLRDSLIKGSDRPVALKPRERDYLHWDNKLTIEFNGESPNVTAIEIYPEKGSVATVFLAGNSTVVDQAKEPYASWGQMIPAFFKPGTVAIANYAESGESLRSFISARRFAKILSLIAPGDYAFVEFGHNDQKQKGEGIGAFTSYKTALRRFVQEVKEKGATPVVVTPLQRRRFDSAGKIVETLGDYPAAARQLAAEEGVALIDLNAMSKVTYEAWGVEKSLKAFVHYPANTFPGQTAALEDNTHFSPFGAFEMAKLVVKGIRDNKLKLAQHISDDVPPVDPARPGSFKDFYWPLSPLTPTVKPDGN